MWLFIEIINLCHTTNTTFKLHGELTVGTARKPQRAQFQFQYTYSSTTQCQCAAERHSSEDCQSLYCYKTYLLQQHHLVLVCCSTSQLYRLPVSVLLQNIPVTAAPLSGSVLQYVTALRTASLCIATKHTCYSSTTQWQCAAVRHSSTDCQSLYCYKIYLLQQHRARRSFRNVIPQLTQALKIKVVSCYMDCTSLTPIIN